LVIPLETVKVMPELTVSVATLALLLLKIKEETVAPAVTVIEAPARTIAVSPLAGTTPPFHEEVLFQLPPADVVTRVAPRLPSAPMNVINVASEIGNSLVTTFRTVLRF
jgi:hypothetical protein